MSLGRRVFVGHAGSIHDPAVAVIEGDCVFAEALERHTQCKRSWEMSRLWYSARPIRKALDRLGIAPMTDGEVEIANSWSDLKTVVESSGTEWPAALENPTQDPVKSLVCAHVALQPLAVNQLQWILSGLRTPGAGVAPPAWVAKPFKVNARGVVHHLAHAATAALTSPFEECTALIADGYGEGTALSMYEYRKGEFKLIHECDAISLGLMYGAITELCGFDAVAGEEWKMMGLAAYGKPKRDIYKFFANRIRVDGLRVSAEFEPTCWFELAGMVGGFRAPGTDEDPIEIADLAHNFQRAFEEVMLKLVRNLREVSRSSNLAFAGGCALNSALNGRLLDGTGFERLHVPSAPADDGNALGAALYLKHVVAGEPRVAEVGSPYLGSAIDRESVERILRFGGTRHHEAQSDDELCAEVAELIASGLIVGWVQGRAEFGPRALGNRSILADPRDGNMKQKINDRVKFRELYRPLAPSILHEFGDEYFESYHEAPYMERALKFRPQVRDRVPAVVHVDGTGRLQTVKKPWNPLFHRLIRAFHEKTGVPILVNTSFNVMGKPIIHSAEDAMTVFYTTGLDRLVIGRFVLEK
jgi:carbamoyltransferase